MQILLAAQTDTINGAQTLWWQLLRPSCLGKLIESHSKFRSFLGAAAGDGLWNQYLIYTPASPVTKRYTSLRCFLICLQCEGPHDFSNLLDPSCNGSYYLQNSQIFKEYMALKSDTMNCSCILETDSTGRCSTQENN